MEAGEDGEGSKRSKGKEAGKGDGQGEGGWTGQGEDVLEDQYKRNHDMGGQVRDMITKWLSKR